MQLTRTHTVLRCVFYKEWIKFCLQRLCSCVQHVTCVCWTVCSALHPDSYDPHARPSLDMSGFDVPVEREVQVESQDVVGGAAGVQCTGRRGRLSSASQ